MKIKAEVTTATIKPNHLNKWLGFFILSLSFVFLGNAAAQSDITTGLVGWWKLADGSGISASDSSGNGNNGSLCVGTYNTSSSTCPSASGPTWYTGTDEEALQFAGSNTANATGQFVLIPDNPPSSNPNQEPLVEPYSTIGSDQGISISLWVYPTVSGEQSIFERAGGYGIRITGVNEGANQFEVDINTSASGWHTALVGGSVNYNQWNHVAMTYTSGSVILYVNGQQVATSTSTIGNISYTTLNVGGGAPAIGASYDWNMGNFFTGMIDDVRLYNNVLNLSQIQTIISSEQHDASPPTISNFSATGITSTSVTINYATNPSSTTVISYGMNSSSLSSTSTADASNTEHSVPLSSLAAQTTYYYTVTATSSVSGLQSTSAVQTFTTASGADDQSQTINENQTLNLTLGDPTDIATIRTIVNNPPNGTVYQIGSNAGSFIYVPRQNYFGTDSFTFQVGPNGTISTINITITEVPQTPVLTDDFPNIVFVVPVNSSGLTQTFQIPAMDVNGSTLTYTITGLPSNMTYNSATGLITATGLGASSVGLIAGNVQVTISNGTPSVNLTKTVGVYVRTPNDWYVAQTALGNGTGSCANAQSMNWVDFENSITGPSGSNWGDNTNQIGPGDTVYLCGVISTGLYIWGSGIAGYPITISFEPGAKMSAPYWGSQNNAPYGAISSYYSGPDFSYIVIDGVLNPDGTTNGIIESTDNGTATMINPLTGKLFANQQGSMGIGSATGFTHFTVKNMTIRNMYVRAPDSFDSNRNGEGIDLTGSNITIQNNIITEGDTLIGLNAGDNDIITGNALLDFNHGITVAPGGGIQGVSANSTNPMAHNLTISNNRLDGWDVWECAGCSSAGLHNDGMIIENESNGYGGAIINFYLYGNEIGPGINPDPNIAGNGTNALFFDMYRATQLENVYIFNNLMSADSPLNWGDGTATGSGEHVLFADNTIVGGGGIGADGQDIHLYNNLLYQAGGVTVGSGSILDDVYFDYNDYYEGAGSTGYDDFSTYSNGILSSFVAWQDLGYGYDQHSTLNQPSLNTNYVPTVDDPGMDLGNASEGNITNWCDPSQAGSALCLDKNGFSRTSSSNWDMGAYQYNSNAYSITLSRSPDYGGSLTCSGGICPSEAVAGTTVTFIMVPRMGYTGAWTAPSACAAAGSNPCTLTINANTAVSANFTASSNFSGPSVTITNPSNGSTLSGNSPVILSATAIPNLNPIQSVQFYIDGAINGSGVSQYLLGTATLNNGSYNYTWNTTVQNNGAFTYRGAYLLTAVATDTAGVIGTPYTINLTISQGTTVVNYGDVNGDGNVTIYDAELTAQYAVGLPVANFNTVAAEVDGNSSVDIYDAYLIAEYAVGLITKFPVQNN